MHISSFAFDPASIQVDVGASVTWDNHDAVSHTVTAYDGSFGSASLGLGDAFTHEFPAAGTFTYYCAIHPSMTAEVVVAGPANAAPLVTVDSPIDGATVAGTITVAGTAADSDGTVASVDVAVGDGAYRAADGTASWSIDVDTAALPNGPVTIRARATDDGGATGEAEVTVTVANEVPTNEPPTVALTAPAAGSVLSGVVAVLGTAADSDGTVARVEVAVGDGPFAAADGTSDWSFSLDTTALPNGEHTIVARAFDGLAHSEVAIVTVTVLNLPDLVAGELQAMSSTTRQTLTLTVTNGGPVAAAEFAVAFHYELDGERHLIAAPVVEGGLAAGASATVEAAWNTVGKVGRFTVTAAVDEADAVPESDEANNDAAADIVLLVDVPGRDLLRP